MKPIVELIRLETGNQGTFGVLRINKEVFCVTLEPPDRANAKSVSCIPAQQYECGRVNSPSKGLVFEVKNVPNRSHILFHSGNTVDHTEGCIILGSSVGMIGKKRGVNLSKLTVAAFMETMKGHDSFHLTITEAY